MNQDEFLQLTFHKQAEVIFTTGQELMQREHLHYLIRLYSLNDFFVEVWFMPGQNNIENIEIIDENDIIKLYDIHLDVLDIFNPH